MEDSTPMGPAVVDIFIGLANNCVLAVLNFARKSCDVPMYASDSSRLFALPKSQFFASGKRVEVAAHLLNIDTLTYVYYEKVP